MQTLKYWMQVHGDTDGCSRGSNGGGNNKIYIN
jgi:hypothetical protein